MTNRGESLSERQAGKMISVALGAEGNDPALHGRDLSPYPPSKGRAVNDEGVKLAVLAAHVDALRQALDEGAIVDAAAEALVEPAVVRADDKSAVAKVENF